MDWKLFFMTFGVVFLAELGDKTQLAALSLTTSGNGGPWTVFIAASTALVCSTALAVLCGSFLAAYINEKYIRIASAVLFIILGIIRMSWSSTVMNTNMFNARNCFVIIGWVVMLIINSSYYAKRSELFVNSV